jgi:UPF0755 protein
MKKLILSFVAVVVLATVITGSVTWWFAHHVIPLKQPVVDFTVQRGSNMRQAASAIAAAGVEVKPAVLYWLARLAGKASLIKAGSYEVHEGITPWLLILKLSAGDVSQGEALLVEGWTFRQVRSALESNPNLQADTAGLSDMEILSRIGASEESPEGLFFPDTYLFDKQSSTLALLARAYQAMHRHLDEAWAARDESSPLRSPYEALILASIIEKETGRAEDRSMVGSVFINRLRIGMRLQTDPTVIYGLGEGFDGRLRRRHLDTDHPWNTYTRVGLPPTPIAMPGRDALLAAVNPQKTDYLYFVARGDGSSEFSRNLNEHNRAVDRYQR